MPCQGYYLIILLSNFFMKGWLVDFLGGWQPTGYIYFEMGLLSVPLELVQGARCAWCVHSCLFVSLSCVKAQPLSQYSRVPSLVAAVPAPPMLSSLASSACLHLNSCPSAPGSSALPTGRGSHSTGGLVCCPRDLPGMKAGVRKAALGHECAPAFPDLVCICPLSRNTRE